MDTILKPPHRSPNPTLDRLLKKKADDPTRTQEVISTSGSKENTDFEKAQSQTQSLNYPDAAHATRVQEKNLEAQEVLAKLITLETKRKSLRKALRSAKKLGDMQGAGKLRDELNTLAAQRKQLLAAYGQRSEANKPSQPESGSTKHEFSSVSSGQSSLVYDTRSDLPKLQADLSRAIDLDNEDEAEAIEKKINILTDAQETTAASNDLMGKKTSAAKLADNLSPDQHQNSTVAQLQKMYRERIEEKKEIEKNILNLKKKNEPSKEILEAEKDLRNLQTEISTLERAISLFGQISDSDENESNHAEIPSSTAADGTHTTRKLIAKALTGNRRPGAVKRSENPARKSTLHFNEDALALLNTKGKQKVGDTLSHIESLSTELRKLTSDRISLQERIRKKKNSRSRPELIQQLKYLDKQIIATTKKLSRIVEKNEAIENLVLPKSAKLTVEEKEKRHADLIERFKSADTKELEKKYKDLLNAYIEENASGTNGWAMLGGWIANLTFSAGNATTRVLGAYNLPMAGLWIGSAVAGGLHAVFVLPILKQLMRETWTSPALSEYNNYWKLVGASWGDWWRDEQDKPKYASKDPQKTELLNIKERLAEEKSFSSLFWNRYKVEELPYYTFLGNYASKGFAAGTLPHLGLSSTDMKWVEGAMHLPEGWISGAETSVLIQEMRSHVPNAKLLPIPSAKIAKAEAEYLRSLDDDLRQGQSCLGKEDTRDPKDPTDREMLKAIAKTQKALKSAELRSGIFGTFRQELKSQFASKDAFLDTIAEAVARIVVLLPSAGIGYVMDSWRKSPDPYTAALGHIVPAVLLILPPGWTARPLVSGVVRAALQAIFNGRSDVVANTQPATTSVQIPDAVRTTSIDGTDDRDGNDVVIDIGRGTFDESSEVVGPPSESDLTDSDDEWAGTEKPNFVAF